MDLIRAIKDTPLPTVLVVAGIIFWLLAIAGSLAGKITVRPEHQMTAGILGTILLVSGLVLSYLPTPQSRPRAATVSPSAPTPDTTVQPSSDSMSKLDGNWLVRRVGCAGRPELNFQIHLENGKISGRFEPKEISALHGSRPPIIGSISVYGEINFNHHKVDTAGEIAGRKRVLHGDISGNSASGHIYHR